MIRAEHITKKFGDFTVLSNVSFCVPKGEIYGLIGYNGVGKTTLLKILCGIYRPDSGIAKIQEKPIYENAELKQRCFFMTEEAAFFHQYSLNQMRKFYSGYYPGWSDKTFYGLVRWFGVDPSMKISRFSKGMQRQASMVLAFATRPEYLFLDEAFDGLDYTMRKQIREMFRYYAKSENAAILVTSHNLKELEDLADHIGMLSDGNLVFNDATKQMKENYQACTFTYSGSVESLESLEPELLEKVSVPEAHGEKNGKNAEENCSEYFCIMNSPKEDAEKKLTQAGVKELQIRPVQLEEFFRKERKERDVDWDEIFG